MPNKALVFNFIGILLQYSLLVLVYYFLFRVIKVMYYELMPGSSVLQKNENKRTATQRQGKLIVIDSGHITLSQTAFTLGETMSIGRNDQNGIIIDDAFVSYEHATIHRSKQGYWLMDLNSTNKTYLNNDLVEKKVLLHSGDVIKIGAVTFSFEG